jgi:hypothetical protein
MHIFDEQNRILNNIYEDLSGAVRVYVKIKPLQPPTEIIKVNENMKSLSVECSSSNKKETFGDFYSVFDGSNTTYQVFTGGEMDSIKNTGVHNSFKQVEDGYSIVLFTYGISGSGKTTLLFGEGNYSVFSSKKDNTSPGLLYLGLISLIDVIKSIRVKNIFEQYIKEFVPTINKMKGRIHELVGTIPKLREYCIDEKKEFEKSLDNVNLENIDVEKDLYKIINAVESYRQTKARIKMTPNNPVSSRSHLYIVLEVLFKSGKTGYITVVDTAGRENPNNIYNTFIETEKSGANLTTLLGPTGGAGVVERFMKKDYLNEYKSKDVYNILREGFYVNETLNHLIYYFNKKSYRDSPVSMQISLDKYSVNKYYVDPRKEEEMIDPNNNCLTIPIMKYLDSLSKKKNDNVWRPTKFITLICLRQEELYCNETFDTLQFANSIVPDSIVKYKDHTVLSTNLPEPVTY